MTEISVNEISILLSANCDWLAVKEKDNYNLKLSVIGSNGMIHLIKSQTTSPC